MAIFSYTKVRQCSVHVQLPEKKNVAIIYGLGWVFLFNSINKTFADCLVRNTTQNNYTDVVLLYDLVLIKILNLQYSNLREKIHKNGIKYDLTWLSTQMTMLMENPSHTLF
jgi:hypothetical protein